MSFMQKEITDRQQWIEVDGKYGTQVYPAEYFTRDAAIMDYGAFSFDSAEVIEGYGARMSAPGYLDATEWTVFATREAAVAYLEEMYGDEEGYEI